MCGGFGLAQPGYRPLDLPRVYVLPQLGETVSAGVLGRLPRNMACDWVRTAQPVQARGGSGIRC